MLGNARDNSSRNFFERTSSELRFLTDRLAPGILKKKFWSKKKNGAEKKKMAIESRIYNRQIDKQKRLDHQSKVDTWTTKNRNYVDRWREGWPDRQRNKRKR
jgi:hypothetical protein